MVYLAFWTFLPESGMEEAGEKKLLWLRPIDRVILCWISFLGAPTSRAQRNYFMFGLLFFVLSKSLLKNGTKEKFWRKVQMFLSVRPIVRIIIRRNALLGALRIACLETFFNVWSVFTISYRKRDSNRTVWTKNSEKNSKCSPRWDKLIEVLDVRFRALRAHKSCTFEF